MNKLTDRQKELLKQEAFHYGEFFKYEKLFKESLSTEQKKIVEDLDKIARLRFTEYYTGEMTEKEKQLIQQLGLGETDE